MKCAYQLYKAGCSERRSPCGERGLKFTSDFANIERKSRSPCGERGLKSVSISAVSLILSSLPVRGAWIEMISISSIEPYDKVAPRAGSVD